MNQMKRHWGRHESQAGVAPIRLRYIRPGIVHRPPPLGHEAAPGHAHLVGEVGLRPVSGLDHGAPAIHGGMLHRALLWGKSRVTVIPL